ncbi:hypothetical protein THAOC_19626, partial [Thalassiosira oceanica]
STDSGTSKSARRMASSSCDVEIVETAETTPGKLSPTPRRRRRSHATNMMSAAAGAAHAVCCGGVSKTLCALRRCPKTDAARPGGSRKKKDTPRLTAVSKDRRGIARGARPKDTRRRSDASRPSSRVLGRLGHSVKVGVVRGPQSGTFQLQLSYQMNPIGDQLQQATSQPEVFLLYEGGQVAEELRRSLTHVRVGPQVTEIPNGAFRGSDKLIKLQLNEGLQVIGDSAFEGCKSLRSVTLPSTVTELSWQAFCNCSSLIELQLNEGLQIIGDWAFKSCTALRSVIIPSTVTVVGVKIFCRCSNLIEVQLKEGLQIIREFAFEYCSALRSVTIPSTVTENTSTAIFDSEEEQGLLDQEALDEMLFDEDGDFAFLSCPLTTVKISISWAVSERMARLPRECMLSVEEKIRNLYFLELLQDVDVLACFPVIRMAPGDEAEDDSEDEAENDTFKVRDPNNETARIMYQVLQLIVFHELKESSIVIELAMWKSRIDGTTPVRREDCRVAIPDPAKKLVMEYCGFLGFLEPVIEGA